MAETVPIPQPPPYPLIGNAAEFKMGEPLKDLVRLADTYGKHCYFERRRKKKKRKLHHVYYTDKFLLTRTFLGEVYKMQLGSGFSIIVSSRRLVNEICNEKRFRKSLKTTLQVSYQNNLSSFRNLRFNLIVSSFDSV